MNSPRTLPMVNAPATSLSFYQMVKIVLEKGDNWTPDSPKNFLGSPQTVVKAVRVALSNGVLKIIEYTDHTVNMNFEGKGVNESIQFNWGRTQLGEEIEELHKTITQAVGLLSKQ